MNSEFIYAPLLPSYLYELIGNTNMQMLIICVRKYISLSVFHVDENITEHRWQISALFLHDEGSITIHNIM